LFISRGIPGPPPFPMPVFVFLRIPGVPPRMKVQCPLWRVPFFFPALFFSIHVLTQVLLEFFPFHSVFPSNEPLTSTHGFIGRFPISPPQVSCKIFLLHFVFNGTIGFLLSPEGNVSSSVDAKQGFFFYPIGHGVIHSGTSPSPPYP